MLYWLEYDAQRKFRYAYKNVSFIGYDRSICPQCSRQVATPQYKADAPHLILEGGRAYPDFLQFCGAGDRLYLVSEKALNLYEKNGITGYSGYRLVTIEHVQQHNNGPHHPEYYCLDITGRIDLDIAAMHIKKKKTCSLCKQYEWSRARLEPIFLDRTTWDGSDLCLVNSIPGFKVCSESLKELTQSQKLTGFSFRTSL